MSEVVGQHRPQPSGNAAYQPPTIEKKPRFQTPIGGSTNHFQIEQEKKNDKENFQEFVKSQFTLQNLVGNSTCSCGNTLNNTVTILNVNTKQKQCLECLAALKKRRVETIDEGNRDETIEYFVMPTLQFPLFTDTWTAKQELKLVQGVQKFGIGNWVEVSNFVQGGKNPEDCEDHYFAFYYKSMQNYKPQGFAAQPNQTNSKVLKGYKINAQQLALNNKVEEAQSKKRIEKQKIIYRPGNQDDIRIAYAGESKQENLTDFAVSMKDRVGYNPYRGDFETEPFDAAEKMIAQMEFCPSDDENDTEKKLSVVKYYNELLNERIRRKKFVIQRGFLDSKRQQQCNRKRTAQEKEIINSMKVFARFNTMQDHEKLVQGLILENNLRQLIDQLTCFKQKGFTQFKQINSYLEQFKNDGGSFSSTKQFMKNNLFLGPSIALEQVSNALKISNSRFHASRQERTRPQLKSLGFQEFEVKFLLNHRNIQDEQYKDFKTKLNRLQQSKGVQNLTRNQCERLKSALDTRSKFVIYDLLGVNGKIRTEQHSRANLRADDDDQNNQQEYDFDGQDSQEEEGGGVDDVGEQEEDSRKKGKNKKSKLVKDDDQGDQEDENQLSDYNDDDDD